MRFLLGACLCLLSATGARAADPVLIWPKLAPGEKADAPPEREVASKKDDKITRLTDVTKPSITIFKPAKEKDTGAAVLICPGGGYNILAWNLEGTEVAEWLNSIGVTGIVLKYRVPSSGKGGLERSARPLQDAQRALGLVRHRAKEWGLDPKRIGVLGFSAGGHLSAALSTNYAKRTYEPVDDADAVSCRPDFTILIYPAYLVGNDNQLSPEIKVTAETPKAFLVHAQDDGVKAESSIFYYLALKNAKVPSELHVFPSGGHGYGLRPSKHSVSHWPARAEQWLKSIEVIGEKK